MKNCKCEFNFVDTVNTKGHFPKVSDDLTIKSFSVIGPLVRYAKDLKLVLKVLVEPEYMPKLKLDEEVSGISLFGV